MNNFVQRTLSSVVYAGSIIVLTAFGTGVWANAFAGVFAVLMLLAIREFYCIAGAGRFQMVWSMICGMNLYGVSWWLLNIGPDGPMNAVVGLVLLYPILITIGLILELWLKAENPVAHWGHLLSSQAMIALPLAMLNGLMAFNHWLVLALFAIIWLNDAGAYCVGSLTAKLPRGNHKMFPRVSPKKSWEGLFGGIALAILTGYIVSLFEQGFSTLEWLLIAAVIAVAANLGDLMESIFKRTLGVKDSGRFLPGHGGVLDRIDSLLLSTPVLTLVLLVLGNC